MPDRVDCPFEVGRHDVTVVIPCVLCEIQLLRLMFRELSG